MNTQTTHTNSNVIASQAKQSHLIPQLRFAEFEGEWKSTHIGNVLTIGSGKDYKHLKEGDIPVYGTGGFMAYVDDYLYEGESVCIGRKGTIDNPIYLNEKFWTVDTLFYTHKFNNCLPKFIFPIFQRINWYKYNEASGVPSLSKKTIDSIKINLPTLPEQQKIASFLTAVDTKLQQLTKKKELLQQYKKGVMQKLFSQQLRFKPVLSGVEGQQDGSNYPDWEEKKLKDVLYEHKTKNNDGSVTEVFSVAKEKGVINQIEHLGRSYAADSTLHYKVAFPGDLIYTKSPTKDFPFGIIKQNLTGRKGLVSPLYVVTRPETNSLGFMFHCYFLSWVNVYNYLVPLVQKGAKNTMNINNDDFLNGAKFILPVSKEEQQQIASYLSALDTKIETVTQQMENTQQFKKGLLQQLFV